VEGGRPRSRNGNLLRPTQLPGTPSALATDGLIEINSNLVEVLVQLDLQQEIPPQLYQAVAELLAFVYRLNQQYRPLSS
jgi:hypothetical protein